MRKILDYDRIHELNHRGVSDNQIGKILGHAGSSINYARHYMKLPPNFPPFGDTHENIKPGEVVTHTKARHKAYYQSDKGKAHRQSDEYKAYQKAFLKAYEQTDEYKAYQKAYHLRNKDSIKAHAKAYYLENKDHIKARTKAYRLRNKDSIKAYDKARRLKKRLGRL